MAKHRSRKKPPQTDALLRALASGDPETRWDAARELGTHGDASAIAALEHVALHDRAQFSREGAFADTVESPALAAFDALAVLYRRIPPTDADVARVRARVADLATPPDDAEQLGATLGSDAAAAVEPLTRHADARVRLRARNVIARVSGARARSALWDEDEDVRVAAAEQDAHRPGLVKDALARFPEEPSVRVRRALAALWLRERARVGGSLHARELEHLLSDPEPAIHATVAREVLETAKRRATWIDDPGHLRETRDRVRALLVPGHTPAPDAALRDALALIEDALAPFEPPPPQPTTTTTTTTVDGDASDATQPDWSVVVSPPPGLSPDVRSALDALGRARRLVLSHALGKKALDEVSGLMREWFAKGASDRATVDVYGATLEDGALVLRFIADHYNYNFAQSGSDWADHIILDGRATLVGGALKDIAFLVEREVHVTEHEDEHYDARAIVDLVRAELRARVGGWSASRAPFHAAIAAVHAASEERARAARGAPAEPPASDPAPRLRCPACASDKVESTLLYDAYQLACAQCGRSEVFETYPEQDSDAHWYA